MSKEYHDKLMITLSDQTDKLVDELPDFAKKFFDNLFNSGMSERTRMQYAHDMKKFFGYLQSSAGFKDTNMKTLRADEVLDRINIDDINEYLRSISISLANDGSKKPTSPAYKARQVCSLRAFYKYYYRIGAIKNNIYDLIAVPKINEKQIKRLEKHDVSRLINAVKNTEGLNKSAKTKHDQVEKRDLAIIMLFCGTGMRVSELVGIDTSDIDFNDASLLIICKGGDQKEVFFNMRVEEALKDYLYDCRPSLLNKSNEKEKAFFLSNNGERLTVSSVQKMIKKYGAAAGLKDKVTPHTLRRTFGTNLYEETGDIFLVSESLHHKSVETTTRHYVDSSKQHKRKAADIAGSLFEDDD